MQGVGCRVWVPQRVSVHRGTLECLRMILRVKGCRVLGCKFSDLRFSYLGKREYTRAFANDTAKLRTHIQSHCRTCSLQRHVQPTVCDDGMVS